MGPAREPDGPAVQAVRAYTLTLVAAWMGLLSVLLAWNI